MRLRVCVRVCVLLCFCVCWGVTVCVCAEGERGAFTRRQRVEVLARERQSLQATHEASPLQTPGNITYMLQHCGVQEALVSVRAAHVWHNSGR